MTPHLSPADEAVDYEKLLVHNCPPAADPAHRPLMSGPVNWRDAACRHADPDLCRDRPGKGCSRWMLRASPHGYQRLLGKKEST